MEEFDNNMIVDVLVQEIWEMESWKRRWTQFAHLAFAFLSAGSSKARKGTILGAPAK